MPPRRTMHVQMVKKDERSQALRQSIENLTEYSQDNELPEVGRGLLLVAGCMPVANSAVCARGSCAIARRSRHIPSVGCLGSSSAGHIVTITFLYVHAS